ncbi:glycoside hydrolase family 43 protein [Metabacillus litoralis]|uniref:glycoside hydrolase family 43 protein n=1 Tax=Metabacillus litoralis TaxID=152268 RepID=UPI0020408505|nr:glycoside hydrolase family 43 protein [Metabacillus litoralis]MCM3160794.1 glycoside hydrolase family 43 protein [Metabacillus litoralis]
MFDKADIQIRDPFILKVENEKSYYLYGTTDKNAWTGPAEGFDVYKSVDLENWEGPFPAFRPQPNFWANMNFWAPEVHEYNGKYYMLASFKAEGVSRGTQILVADDPLGPFHPHSDGPVTPKDWECLDGTLYIDNNDQPWMVFCHEWMQIKIGTIDAIKLSESLDRAIGEPITLFSAIEAPWVTQMPLPEEARILYPDASYYVTDGPFLHRCQDGSLLMLWSSFKNGMYAQGIAVSLSGEIQGPWVQNEDPIFESDGGHGMIFRTFEGQLKLALHSPNDSPNERPIFIDLNEKDNKLVVAR